MPKCAFCGNQIELGTGKLFVYVSGKQDYFCSSKCEKNLLHLKRKPLKIRWTEAYRKEHKKGLKVEEKKEAVKPEVKKVEKIEEKTVEKVEEKKEVVQEQPKEEVKKEVKEDKKE